MCVTVLRMFFFVFGISKIGESNGEATFQEIQSLQFFISSFSQGTEEFNFLLLLALSHSLP